MGLLALAFAVCLAAVVTVLGIARIVGARQSDVSRNPIPATPVTPLMQGAAIGISTARLLQAAFLVLIALPAAYQFTMHPGEESEEFLRFLRAPNAEARDELDKRLTRESEWGRDARRAYQAVATYTLRQGSPKVIIGDDQYLFFRDDVRFPLQHGFLSAEFKALRPPKEQRQDALRHFQDFLLSRKTEPRPKSARPQGDDIVGCIVDFRDQLQARGIHLVLLPVPCKATIYPEKLWHGYPEHAGPALNADFKQFLQLLAEAKVDVLDLTSAMWQAKSTANPSLWLLYDTHWSPAAVTLASNQLTAHVQPLLGNFPRRQYHAVPSKWVEDAEGELIHMLLEQRADPDQFPRVEHSLMTIWEGDHLATADDEAPVLLLGDSFAWFYTDKSAGLAEQMMLRIGTAVEEIDIFAVSPSQGIYDPRLVLAERPGALANKKVVIWEFTNRILADPEHQWEKIRLPEVSAQNPTSPP